MNVAAPVRNTKRGLFEGQPAWLQQFIETLDEFLRHRRSERLETVEVDIERSLCDAGLSDHVVDGN